MRTTSFFEHKSSLNCKGKIINLSTPVVMGIINLTPDSFYDGGRYNTPWDMVKHAGSMLESGAAILDVGAASSRPGAAIINPEEEQQRLLPALKALAKAWPQAVISVDTYHASTVRMAVDEGAAIINDISAGAIDPAMFETIASLQVPYVLMHMQGMPGTMQQNPTYKDPVKEISMFFAQKILQLRRLGVHDIIIDPGFGFGKSVEDNYRILQGLEYFGIAQVPLLVGLSRKSMVNKVLGVSPQEALNGTTVLHALALQKGASILRVHDVKEAVETIKLLQMINNKIL